LCLSSITGRSERKTARFLTRELRHKEKPGEYLNQSEYGGGGGCVSGYK
jgi:hypothetical protein